MGADARPNGFTKEDAQTMYNMHQSGKKLSEIAEICSTDRHTIGRVLQRNGFVVDRKTYHCDEHYFDNIDDSNKAYLIGLL